MLVFFRSRDSDLSSQVQTDRGEAFFEQDPSSDESVKFWSLPSQILGNKVNNFKTCWIKIRADPLCWWWKVWKAQSILSFKFPGHLVFGQFDDHAKVFRRRKFRGRFQPHPGRERSLPSLERSRSEGMDWRRGKGKKEKAQTMQLTAPLSILKTISNVRQKLMPRPGIEPGTFRSSV